MIIFGEERPLEIRYYSSKDVDEGRNYAPRELYSLMYPEIIDIIGTPRLNRDKPVEIGRSANRSSGCLSVFECMLTGIDWITLPSKYPLSNGSQGYKLDINSPNNNITGSSIIWHERRVLEPVARKFETGSLIELNQLITKAQSQNKARILLVGVEPKNRVEIRPHSGKSKTHQVALDEEDPFHLMGVCGEVPDTIQDILEQVPKKT